MSESIQDKDAEGISGSGGRLATRDDLVAAVGLLEPLSSTARRRLVDSALAFLGDAGTPSRVAKGEDGSSNIYDEIDQSDRIEAGPRLARWMGQGNVTNDELTNVFHQGEDGRIDVTVNSVHERTVKGQVEKIYLLAGVMSLIREDRPVFTDEEARELCREFNAYDAANHATYVKALGRFVSGSKSSGWELTRPGLNAASTLVKELNNENG